MFNISGKMCFEARPVSSPEYWNGALFLLDVVGLLRQFDKGNIVITDTRNNDCLVDSQCNISEYQV